MAPALFTLLILSFLFSPSFPASPGMDLTRPTLITTTHLSIHPPQSRPGTPIPSHILSMAHQKPLFKIPSHPVKLNELDDERRDEPHLLSPSSARLPAITVPAATESLSLFQPSWMVRRAPRGAARLLTHTRALAKLANPIVCHLPLFISLQRQSRGTERHATTPF